MNPSSSYAANRCSQISADNVTNPFEDLGLHKLWRRQVPLAAKSAWTPLARGLWPLQLAMDKVESIFSKHLYWFAIGQFDTLGIQTYLRHKHFCVEMKFSSSVERIQKLHSNSHLAQHQREQRLALLNWLWSEHRARFEVCYEQLETLNPHLQAASPKGIRPVIQMELSVNQYLDKLRSWTEMAYDQGKFTADIPEPDGQPTSGQLSEIGVGGGILCCQMETRAAEIALIKYIHRCNWGRFLVKLSLLAPIATLCTPCGVLFKLSGFGLGLIGLIGATRLWHIAHEQCSEEMSHSVAIGLQITELLLKLLERENDLRPRESAEEYFRGREPHWAEYREECARRQAHAEAAASATEEFDREILRKFQALAEEISKHSAASSTAKNMMKEIREDYRNRGMNCDFGVTSLSSEVLSQ